MLQNVLLTTAQKSQDAFNHTLEWLRSLNRKTILTIMGAALATHIELYRLAMSEYVQRVEKLQARTYDIISHAEDKNWQDFLIELPKLQNSLVPIKPRIFNPFIVIGSFIDSFNNGDINVINEMQNLIRKKRVHLNNAILNGMILTPITSYDGKNYEKDKTAIPHLKDFAGSNFSKALLKDAIMEDIDFYTSNFQDANLAQSKMINCNFVFVNMQHASLIGTDLQSSKLTGGNLKKAILSDANFESADLSNAELKEANISKTNFKNAYLMGANLEGALYFETANFKGSKYNSQKITGEDSYVLLKKESLEEYCAHKGLVKNCIAKKLDNDNCSEFSKEATKFPKGFNPQEAGMIDIYEVIQFVKNKR